MRYALTNGQRREAEPGLSGECPSCLNPVVAKCGEIKIRHWAHRGKRICDAWWENETEWHRQWKDQFPVEWQEHIHTATDGEKHIADVKTSQGWVLEFQYSAISPEERRSRNDFYKKLVWVVNGQRRKRDSIQFAKAWNGGTQIGNAPFFKTINPASSLLIQEWSNGTAPVFFDFGEPLRLWWLFPTGPDGLAYIGAFPRANFIDLHRGSNAQNAQEFEALLNDFNGLIANYSRHQAQVRNQTLAAHTTNFLNGRPNQQIQSFQARGRRRF